jgi:hypothetical protein
MVSSAELVLGHPITLPCQLLHVPDPQHVDMASLPMKPASYAAAADSPPAHLAASRAKCQPVQGAGQGAKTFRIQIGQKVEIISVDDLKPHTFALPH